MVLHSTKTSVATEIFTTLRREILSGKFAKNEKLPSEQMLVQRFKVARTTVRLALKVRDCPVAGWGLLRS